MVKVCAVNCEIVYDAKTLRKLFRISKAYDPAICIFAEHRFDHFSLLNHFFVDADVGQRTHGICCQRKTCAKGFENRGTFVNLNIKAFPEHGYCKSKATDAA